MNVQERIAILQKEIERRQFPYFAKNSWPNFIDGWFYQNLFEQLQYFYELYVAGMKPKLKLSVPPRHGKSETIIRFCLFNMMKSQTEIILTTYSQEQANRISEKARRIAESIKIYRNGGKREWECKNGSVFRAVGRGGGLTGTGADLLVLDDMIKNSEEADSPTIREKLWDFYLTTAETRLSPKGSQLAIGTRWHKADLLGRLIDGWIDIAYPAIAEKDETHRQTGEALHARFPIHILMQIREKISGRFWSALYQGHPVDKENAIIKGLRIINESQIPPADSCSDIISIDCSFKGDKNSDFNAIQRWRIKWPYCYCIEAYNFKAGFSKLLDTLSHIIKGDEYAILIEEKANGAAIIDSIQDRYPNIIPIVPTESKFARFQSCAPMFESEHVFFSNSIQCFADIEEQFLNFPHTTNDDQVDACSQALNWAKNQSMMLGDVQTIRPFWA